MRLRCNDQQSTAARTAVRNGGRTRVYVLIERRCYVRQRTDPAVGWSHGVAARSSSPRCFKRSFAPEFPSYTALCQWRWRKLRSNSKC